MNALGVLIVTSVVGLTLLAAATLKGYGVQAAVILALVLTMALLGMRSDAPDDDS